ncbi:sulfite exporter TauE/SafE family protein [Salegentibacter agarivorans]
MWISALIFGLLGSFHCVGMCGPIAFLLPVDHKNNLKKLGQISLYHFGRISSYALIGILFGLLGKSFRLFGLQQQLSILLGVLMILVILIPYKKFSKYNGSKFIFKIVSKVKSNLGKQLKQKSPDTFYTIGFLNGFLPCGLVYMAVFGAIASGTALEGSLYMALFGLGTVPLMTAAIYLGNFINLNLKSKIRKAVPVFVVIMGLLFILRGMGLGIPYLSPMEIIPEITAAQSCH